MIYLLYSSILKIFLEASVNDQSLGDVNSKLDSMGLAPPSITATMKPSTSMNSIGGRGMENINDNPDSAINRQDIAMGGMTPIAARESVVKYQMSTKEDQFTEIQHFTVYCATWNVNGQSPSGSVRELSLIHI